MPCSQLCSLVNFQSCALRGPHNGGPQPMALPGELLAPGQRLVGRPQVTFFSIFSHSFQFPTTIFSLSLSRSTPTERFPAPSDLWLSLPAAAFLILLRAVAERAFFRPLGIVLGVPVDKKTPGWDMTYSSSKTFFFEMWFFCSLLSGH